MINPLGSRSCEEEFYRQGLSQEYYKPILVYDITTSPDRPLLVALEKGSPSGEFYGDYFGCTLHQSMDEVMKHYSQEGRILEFSYDEN